MKKSRRLQLVRAIFFNNTLFSLMTIQLNITPVSLLTVITNHQLTLPVDTFVTKISIIKMLNAMLVNRFVYKVVNHILSYIDRQFY